MTFTPPESFNIADYFLDARVREGRGRKIAIVTDERRLTYSEVQSLANRFGHVLRTAGLEPEQRLVLALPDGPEFVGALFGALKIGGVAVMVNPELKPEALQQILGYTRATVVLAHADSASGFRNATRNAPFVKRLLILGEPELDERLAAAPEVLVNFASHRDDPAIWLFSGGTTGRPKAVIQTHASFANTTECYGKRAIQYHETDVTISVPKLFFGYATGSNLFFPFSVGASTVLFPERCTADVLFQKIARFRPTILVNVPTVVNQMVGHPEAGRQDLSCLRLSTSAGEALPVELHRRWTEMFGVELLDGLGTAEMWHIFLTNLPGSVKPGTVGSVVPGFQVKVCGENGEELPDGEVGWLWVRGNSRAIGYWQLMESTKQVFRGEWVVTGDLVRRAADGTFTHCGRADDMLKVSGKWLSPQEVESCLLQHPAVREVAVVGVSDALGLVKPHAFVVASEESGVVAGAQLADDLKAFVRERLDAYKHPREVLFLESLPRTHLGKVDRGRLKRT